MREQVKWFAEEMEIKLKRNDYKGGWDDCSYDYLINRLEGEIEELRALEGNPDVMAYEVIHECTDIANFAMMIADQVRKATR